MIKVNKSHTIITQLFSYLQIFFLFQQYLWTDMPWKGDNPSNIILRNAVIFCGAEQHQHVAPISNCITLLIQGGTRLKTNYHLLCLYIFLIFDDFFTASLIPHSTLFIYTFVSPSVDDAFMVI